MSRLDRLRSQFGPWSKRLFTVGWLACLAFAVQIWTHPRPQTLGVLGFPYEGVAAAYGAFALAFLVARGFADGLWAWLVGRARGLELPRPTVDRESVVAVAVVALLVVSAAAVPALFASTQKVEATAPSSDYVYSASFDQKVTKLDTTGGEPQWNFTGHTARVEAVQLGPNGDRVFSGARDNTVRAIDPSDGSQLWSFTGHSDNVRGLAVSPDGSVVYSASSDNTVKAIDASDGSEIWTFTNHSGKVKALAAGPNGDYVYSVSNDATLQKIDASDGTVVWAFEGKGQNYEGVALSPDGSTVYASGAFNTVIAVDASTATKEWETSSYGARTNALEAAPDGGAVYVGIDDSTVRALDPADGSELWSYAASNAVVAISVSPDSSTVYSGVEGTIDGNDNYVRAHDASDGSQIWRYDGHTSYVRGVSGGGAASATAGPAYEINGTVTNADGSALSGASITVTNSTGDTVGTNTTTSTGAFSVGVANGSYTVEASASGYIPETKSVDIDGASKTVDFQLDERGVSGTVTNLQGDPVANATVEVVTVNRSEVEAELSNPTPQEIDEEINDYIANATPDTPPDYRDQQDGSFGLSPSAPTPESFGGQYALLYDRSTLNANAQLSFWGDNADLSSPVWAQVPAGEPLVVASVDPTNGAQRGFLEDEYDQQVYGEISGDQTVTFTALVGPDGTSTTRVTTDQTLSGGPGDPSTMDYGTVTLSPGFYEVSVEGSDASYVIKVGDPIQAISEDLKADAGDNPEDILTTASNATKEAFDQNVFSRKTTSTNADGEFSVQIADSNVETVVVQAYKAPSTDISTQNLQLSDVRNISDSEEAPSVYFPSRPVRADVPQSDVQVRMAELSFSPYANQSDFQEKYEDLLAALKNGTFSELPPAVQESLEDINSDELERLYTQLDQLRQESEMYQDAYERVLAAQQNISQSEVQAELNASEASDEQLRERINALQQTITELQSTIDVQQESSETTTEDGEALLSRTWSVAGDVDPDGTLIRVHKADGTTDILNGSSEYVTVDQGVTGTSTTISLSEYPLDGAAAANVVLDVATTGDGVGDPGVGHSEAPVQNPTFGGNFPSLEAIRFSSLEPGPDERVTAELQPAEAARFGSLANATVTAPDGTTVATNVTASTNEFAFTTDGAGAYRVETVFTNPGGQRFTEVQYLSVDSEDTERPPSVRSASGPTGLYALAGDGLESARIETSAGGAQTTITAILPEGSEVPGSVHVYTNGLDLSPDADVTVNVVKGPTERALDRRVNVVLHTPAVSEDAHIRVNGAPLPPGAQSSLGSVDARANGTTVDVLTDPSGSVEVRTNNDPGLFDEVNYFLDRQTAGLSIPFLTVDMAPALPTPTQAAPSFVVALGLAGAAARARGGDGR